MTDKNTTIKDVAKATGFSAMTITRCFTKGYVAASTREIIEKAANELGYVPNILAKTLRNGKSNVVGALWLSSRPHLASRISTTHNLIQSNSYTPWINSSLTLFGPVKDSIRHFLSQKVAGAIIQLNETLVNDKEIQQLLRLFKALVLVLPERCDLPYDQVILDRANSINETLDYLVGKGRKNICLIASSAARRDKSFLSYLEGSDKVSNFEIVRPDDNVANVGERYCKALEDAYPDQIPFDAILTTNDTGAIAVMSFLQKRGLDVPNDIAVIGANNDEFSTFTTPPLATVDVKAEEIATTATNLLIERITNPDKDIEIKDIYSNFIIRQSAGL